MGNLIWHQYSRLITLTASIYTIWAGIWGIVYRKFFWDFIGGTLVDPGGILPPAKDAVFIDIIVKLPIIQICAIVMGILLVALDYPAPFLKTTALHRSIALRIPLLLIQAALAALFYQGTNGAIWSLLALLGYIRAVALGEKMESAKGQRGTAGAV